MRKKNETFRKQAINIYKFLRFSKNTKHTNLGKIVTIGCKSCNPLWDAVMQIFVSTLSDVKNAYYIHLKGVIIEDIAKIDG